MDRTNGFRQQEDIGGPMELHEAYRWNVPTVTYGFAPSFLEYFGSNGVRAVEGAIGMINGLPTASAVVLTDVPKYTQRANYAAEAAELFDLRSATLATLLEQLGLTQAQRNVFVLRKWDPVLATYTGSQGPPIWVPEIVPEFVRVRNFDPLTYRPTDYVNGTWYKGIVLWYGMAGTFDSYFDVVETAVNPLDPVLGGVAGAWLDPGLVFTGLTYDDVGGLAYLLGTNNIVGETLLPDVSAADPAQHPVNAALRPGVEKITFVPHPLLAATGGFSTFTHDFTDTYYSNGVAVRQQLRRIVTQPDFLFSATDTAQENSWPVRIQRTAPSHWINNSGLNGDGSRPGPGVIAPPINIPFHKLGTFVSSNDITEDCTVAAFRWGSFDLSTNAPIAFPIMSPGQEQPLDIHFVLRAGNGLALPHLRHTWRLPVALQKQVLLQTSTNLVDWVTLDTVVNEASVIFWEHRGIARSQRFFRTIPRS